MAGHSTEFCKNNTPVGYVWPRKVSENDDAWIDSSVSGLLPPHNRCQYGHFKDDEGAPGVCVSPRFASFHCHDQD